MPLPSISHKTTGAPSLDFEKWGTTNPNLRSSGSTLSRLSRLCSDCGIKLCVIVEVIFDDLIALARDLREPRDVENVNFSASVFDKSFSLENRGCRRNRGAAPSKHVCEKLVRNLECVDMCAVRANEKPAGEPLFRAVFRIASGRLHRLNELRLNIAQSQKLKMDAKAELPFRILDVTGLAMSGNLRVDAIQTLFCSHESR